MSDLRAIAPALLLALVLVLLLGACAGAPAPVDSHYRLIAEAPAALSRPALGGTLLVKRFAADSLLAQRPVVYARQDAPQAFHQYNAHLWADPPTVMIQELTARVLREARVAARVVTPAHGVSAEYELVGRIERLEHLLGEAPSVAVVLELGVFHQPREELIGPSRYSETQPVEGPGVNAAVLAMNAALTRIMARFVADLASR